MTSEISYNNSNKKSKSFSEKLDGIINLNLLWDSIKRNKVLMIIVGILMFFASPFIVILARIEYGATYYLISDGIYTTFYDYVNDNILRDVVFVFALFGSIALGLILALTVMRYMHKTKSAIFFNSIPVNKRVFYTTQCLSGLIYFIVPLIAMYLLSIAILPSYVTIATLSKILIVSVFIFILSYSFVIMCANIAGTTFNSILTTGYLSFIVAGCYLIFASFIETFYRFTNIRALLRNLSDKVFLPVIYLIINFGEKWDNMYNTYDWVHKFHPVLLLDLLYMLLASALFFFIGGLLNNINKTENAEKAFYFKISQTIFKYTILALAVLTSGILFYQGLGNSILYIILGVIIGGFLALLATNFIIYKSIREVFRGFRKFGIFIIAASLIMCVFSYDIFGIDKYIPEVSQVESVEMGVVSHYNDYNYYLQTGDGYYNDYYNTGKIKITDAETIGLVNNVLKAAMKSTRDITLYSTYSISMDGTANMDGAEINYNLKNGASVNKRIPYLYDAYFTDKSDLDAYSNAANILRESRGYKKAYYYPLSDIDVMKDLLYNKNSKISSVSCYDYNGNINSEVSDFYMTLSKDELMTLTEKIRQDIFSDDSKIQFYNYNYYKEPDRIYSINFTITEKLKDGNEYLHSFDLNVGKQFKNTIAFIESHVKN